MDCLYQNVHMIWQARSRVDGEGEDSYLVDAAGWYLAKSAQGLCFEY